MSKLVYGQVNIVKEIFQNRKRSIIHKGWRKERSKLKKDNICFQQFFTRFILFDIRLSKTQSKRRSSPKRQSLIGEKNSISAKLEHFINKLNSNDYLRMII